MRRATGHLLAGVAAFWIMPASDLSAGRQPSTDSPRPGGPVARDETPQARIRALEARVAALEQTIAELKASLRILARQVAQKDAARREHASKKTPGADKLSKNDPADAEATPNGKWNDRKTWRRLQKGMTKQHVWRLFGTPDRISQNALLGEFWRYGSPLASGEVHFSKTGFVIGWKEP